YKNNTFLSIMDDYGHSNNNTIELTMNQEKYGNIENSITISPDKISFSSINHDSYTSINNSRVLIKIK
ncbi:MAG: hypothetical protein PSX81_04550, partial [bacterium]|nr:hypothetical protein [bacterium]